MEPLLLGVVKLLFVVQATVAGTVRDEATGAPLVGAVVALTDPERVAATTDAAGRYVLRGVSDGPHYFVIRFFGYAPRVLQALVPGDGELEINVSLRPEPFRLPTIDVRPPSLASGLENSELTAWPDRSSTMAAAWNNPMLAEPDAFQVLAGGEVVLSPEAPTGMHIRGGASDQTAYLLDGIPVFSPYHAAGMFSAWNPDALARLDLSSSTPSPSYPDVLSGTVSATTRGPGDRARSQGGFSSTQARLTLDGPLGVGGAGYLVSVRSGYPDIVAPKHESSYLNGQTGDWLVKLEGPAFGGRVRLVGYDSHNGLNASATATGDPVVAPRRNFFQWRSRSLGGEWSRAFGRSTLRVLGWRASGSAGAAWGALVGPIDLTSNRRDDGVLAALEHHSERATTVAGLRVQFSTTSYLVDADSAPAASWSLASRTTVAAAFVEQTRALNHRVELKLSASLSGAAGSLHLGPRGQLRWRVSDYLTLSGSYARLHQFAQSLRNAESVVGNVFPADLYVGVGSAGVPVARSDQGVIAADFRPKPGVRFGVQAYQRSFDGLLLVAPREGEPFTTGTFAVGSGSSRGLSVEAAVTSARVVFTASYGWQRVLLRSGGIGYTPDHGVTHLLQGGINLFPAPSLSIRLGATAGFGRRTTTVSSGLEWEACNLVDRGCEFAGSPHYTGQRLGGTRLPPYLRVDLGVRQDWHIRVGGREGLIGLFGTVTNVFGRSNMLTYARDPATGDPVGIEMRPRAPLVVGLDWQF